MAAAGIFLAAGAAQTVSAAFHTFDTEAQAIAEGWTGHRNRPAGGEPFHDYGWSDSNHTTAPSGDGEAGGQITDRSAALSWYAGTTGISYTHNDVFIASGRLRLPDGFPVDGGYELGFFDRTSTGLAVGGIDDFAGIRFNDGNRVFARLGGNAGNFATLSGADASVPLRFSIRYEPSLLRVQVYRASDNALLANVAAGLFSGETFTMNSFGIISTDNDFNNGRLTRIFIDDVLVVPEPACAGLWGTFVAGLALMRRVTGRTQERRE